jgi:F0F1-type ATP synthase membrane subunit a
MKNIFASYTFGIFVLVMGVMSLIQSANPSFLAQADSANLNANASSAILATIGLALLVIAISIIIYKTLKLRKDRNG